MLFVVENAPVECEYTYGSKEADGSQIQQVSGEASRHLFPFHIRTKHSD